MYAQVVISAPEADTDNAIYTHFFKPAKDTLVFIWIVGGKSRGNQKRYFLTFCQISKEFLCIVVIASGIVFAGIEASTTQPMHLSPSTSITVLPSFSTARFAVMTGQTEMHLLQPMQFSLVYTKPLCKLLIMENPPSYLLNFGAVEIHIKQQIVIVHFTRFLLIL